MRATVVTPSFIQMEEQTANIIKQNSTEGSEYPLSMNETAELNLIRNVLRDLDHYGLATESKIPSPNIVLVGDQSSGKSSLVEAISHIKVPRDTGTCTRVPLEINLTKDTNPWTASVSILQKWEYVSDKKGLKRKNAPLNPWMERSSPILSHFVDVTAGNSNSLSSVIRWAQHALLNPGIPLTDFIQRALSNESISSGVRVGFSPNPIIVDIKGPDLPNLSFKDLPGIVAQASEKDGGMDAVRMIKKIAESYATAENTLVVLVVSMETDVETSSSSALVSRLKLNNSCLGVLTKPDRLAPLNVQQWLEVLEGKMYQRGLGYYVTKQPADVNVSYDQAREEETEYFSSDTWTKHFAHLEGSHSRFGTANLQLALAKENERMIRNHLPDIFESVRIALEDTSRSLEELPVIKDPISAIRGVVQTFESNLYRMTSQTSSQNNLKSALKTLKEEFGELIVDTCRPLFRHGEDLQMKKQKKKDVVVLDDSDDDRPSVYKVTPPSSTNSSPRKRTIDSTDLKRNATFTAHEIWSRIEDFDFHGTGDLYDPRVIDEILRDSLDWHDATEDFYRKVKDVFFTHFRRIERSACLPYQGCKLEEVITSVTENYIDNFLDRQFAFATEHYRRERAGACVRNKSARDTFIAQHVQKLTAVRQDARVEKYFHKYFQGDVPPNFKELVKKKLGQRFSDLVEHEAYEREIKVMAKVQAYYHLAATRFVEMVWMGLHADLNKLSEQTNLFAETIHRANQDPNYASSLVEQDSHKLAKRAALLEKQSKLEKIWTQLNQLQIPQRKIEVSNRDSEGVEKEEEEEEED